MASEASSSSHVPWEEEEFIYGGESGWVEARTSCDHLNSLSSDLSHIPTPDTPCIRLSARAEPLPKGYKKGFGAEHAMYLSLCHNLAENWLCLCCKDVLCSRFVNKHMLEHFQEKNHCLALSYSDLSVWCFSCDGYLDAQVIWQLRPVYQTTYLLKFGEAPPFRALECLQGCDNEADGSSPGH